jgi:hypothetical protein
MLKSRINKTLRYSRLYQAGLKTKEELLSKLSRRQSDTDDYGCNDSVPEVSQT